eukprot:14542694-Alexandrium_andersonii.AAC.1
MAHAATLALASWRSGLPGPFPGARALARLDELAAALGLAAALLLCFSGRRAQRGEGLAGGGRACGSPPDWPRRPPGRRAL